MFQSVLLQFYRIFSAIFTFFDFETWLPWYNKKSKKRVFLAVLIIAIHYLSDNKVHISYCK